MSDYAEIAPDALREFIRSGLCPWCKRGPYTVLASHVSRAHDIDPRTFRDMANLFYRDSICDPAFAQRRRETSVELGLTPPRTAPGKKKPARLSKAAKQALIDRCEEMRQNQTPEQQMRGAKAAGAIRAAQLRKQRGTCAICGGAIPFVAGKAAWRTCSPGCRRELKRRNTRVQRQSQPRQTPAA